MNEVKTAFVEALEKSGDALHELVGTHDLPRDIREQVRIMKDANFRAKQELVDTKDVFRCRVPKLRRADPRQGDWPLFRAVDAEETLETIEQIEAIARIRTRDASFHAARSEALKPMRAVVEKYGTKTVDGWRFPEDSADMVAPFPDPPPTGTAKVAHGGIQS